MKYKSLFSIAILSGLLLTGCGKKVGPFAADYFSVVPQPLEVVGTQVPATVTANIPAKFFQKNAEVTVTPYLVYSAGETAGTSFTYQGEKVRGNNTVISYNNGGTATMPISYIYTPEMQKSELYLAFDVAQGGKSYQLPRVKVADGIIATATMANAGNVNPAITPDKFQRVINEKYKADIMFLIQQANIRKGELTKDEMADLNAKIKEASVAENKEIKEVNISSYASPDGGVELNTKLAENREKNTKGYIKDNLKKNKIENIGDLTADFTAQDWEGLQELVKASDMQDKELILSVLSMYKDPEQREREMKNLSSVFTELAKDVLPKLRYSRITASIDVIGKSDEEIKKLAATEPNKLSVDELLYSATLTNDNEEKMKIYSDAASIYPNDYRCYNNIGVCQFIDTDYEAAEQSFKQAAKLAPANSEVQMNQGLIELLNKNYSQAENKFGNAAGAEGLGAALGTYYIQKGDYQAAVRSFGDSKTNNAALAQILTKDYSKAKTTLAGIANPNADTYYLQAVLGARTNNEQMVYSNLREAIKLDSSVKSKAANDLEFSKFNLAYAL